MLDPIILKVHPKRKTVFVNHPPTAYETFEQHENLWNSDRSGS